MSNNILTDSGNPVRGGDPLRVYVDMQTLPPSSVSITPPTGGFAQESGGHIANIDTQLSGTGALKDNGPAWTTKHGVSSVPFTSADQHGGLASVTDAPTAGQKLVITDIFVSVDTAMSVTFKEETATNPIVSGPYYLSANSTLQLTPRSKPWKLSAADKKLQVITSVAGNIMVDAGYYSEA